MAYDLLSQSRKLNKWGTGGPNKSGGLEHFLKKTKWGERLLGTQEYGNETVLNLGTKFWDILPENI